MPLMKKKLGISVTRRPLVSHARDRELPGRRIPPIPPSPSAPDSSPTHPPPAASRFHVNLRGRINHMITRGTVFTVLLATTVMLRASASAQNVRTPFHFLGEFSNL